MKSITILLSVILLSTLSIQAQNTSNIATYTPSKLLAKGQVDIKWFNNMYTETESTFSPTSIARQNFFTSSFDVFTGISSNNRVNAGILFEIRSNTIGGGGPFDVFKFSSDTTIARSGLSSFAPAIKFNPFKSVSNFTIQSAFHIPTIKRETNSQGVFLDQNGFIFQNRFFFDHTFKGDKFQFFAELNAELNFGEAGKSFANNSLSLTPGVFLSYIVGQKFTVLVLAQHNQRLDLGNEFTQDFTAVGGGVKYQLTEVLNLEVLQTNFIRGNNTGLGQTYNLGLRALF
jgi:hypothetical protein